MDDKVNLAEKLASFDERFSPKIVGYLNEYKLAVVKARGEFVWHSHEETDDFFLVLEGKLTIQLRDHDVTLAPGELFVVPRGVQQSVEDSWSPPGSSSKLSGAQHSASLVVFRPGIRVQP